MRENVDWEVTEKRREFLEELYPLVNDWTNKFPDYRGIFRPEEIEWLLQESVESASCDDGKNKLLSLVKFACRIGYRHQPEVDENGRPLRHRTTPLHRLARQQHVPGSQGFIELFEIYDRFDVNYEDAAGFTHFHVACKFNCEEAVKKFLEAGQDPNLRVPTTMDSPLHLAVDGIPDIYDEDTSHDRRNNTVPNRRVTESLLRGGADPNLVNERGETPLHVICKRKDNDDLMQRFLAICDELQVRVQVDVRDQEGNAPLHLAVRRRRLQLIGALLRAGANPNVANAEGSRPLHLMCQSTFYNILVMPFLAICRDIGQTVQIDATDNESRTPLQLAMACISPGVVNLLLDRGADLSSFASPSLRHYGGAVEFLHDRVKVAAKALAVVKSVETRTKYAMKRHEALTVMRLFDECELFRRYEGSNFENRWYDNNEFADRAKEIQIKPKLTLHDLVQLRPDKAAKLFTHSNYLVLAALDEYVNIPQEPRELCALHLFETMSKTFFREWATEPFSELSDGRFPLECCLSIIYQLSNADLYRIVLAAEGYSF
uniref:Uncharacterized protein n=1 Tax=Trichogramma kaykai TaxID=54128 RepID=A0ABD2XBR7_9HYME